MDQESIAFFEERFRAISREISGLRQETTQQIASLREETAQQFASFREEIDRRLDKQDETARHTLILVEGLRGDLQLVGEVVMGYGEQLKRYHNQSIVSFQEVQKWIRPPFEELRRHRDDLDRRHGELNLKHGELDLKQEGLDHRVRILEDRADRQQGDVMDAIRQMVQKYRREAQPASE